MSVCLSHHSGGELYRLGSITDAVYILWSSDRTASGEREYNEKPTCTPNCVVRRVDWKREAEGSNRGRGAFSKRRPSQRGLGEVGVGSAGSVLKVKGGVCVGGGDLLCSHIKELEGGLLLHSV